MSGQGAETFRKHAGLAVVTVAVGWVLAAFLPREPESRQAAFIGVGLAAVTGAVAFVAGFFGTYFVLQWIEVSYVMAASRDAAGGDE